MGLFILPTVYICTIIAMPLGLIPLSGIAALVVGIGEVRVEKQSGASWFLLSLALSELFALAGSAEFGGFNNNTILLLGFGAVQLAAIVYAFRRVSSPGAGLAFGWFSVTYAGYAALIGLLESSGFFRPGGWLA